MKKTRRVLPVLFIILWPAACVAKPPLPQPVSPLLVTLNQTDAPDAVYTFKAGDQLEVIIPSAPELSRSVTVDHEGRFHLPYIGQVAAAGLSIGELRDTIETALDRELLDPRVDLVLTTNAAQPTRARNCACTPATATPE